ncbi:hypothetical protein SMICM17S_06362 [Streptomyces microflavus]
MRQRAALCRDRLDAPLFRDRAARALWEVTDAERSPALSGTDRPKALTARRIGRRRPPHPKVEMRGPFVLHGIRRSTARCRSTPPRCPGSVG